jgi:transposase-like protein
MIQIKFKCPYCGREGISNRYNKIIYINKKRVRCFKCNKSFLVRKDMNHDYTISIKDIQ